MKELSIEEKAKAYDEALKKAKDMMHYKEVRQEDIEYLFPELAESEDERIRKEMITYLSTVEDKELIPYESWIAWLEKQGEQKPAEEYNITGISSNKSQGKLGEIIKNLKTTWSEKDEVGLANAMWAIEQARTIAKDENDMGNLWYAERWLKSLKDRVQPQPKQEWSEADKEMIDLLISIFMVSYPNRVYKANPIDTIDMKSVSSSEIIDWLKSIRPQNRWKPSEHEITVLEKIQHGEINPSNPTLHRVIKCLKKLMEE